MSMLPQLLEQYSNLILSIEEDCNENPLWQRFYQIQMASFIMRSKDMNLGLHNALKAYNLIRIKWMTLEQELESSKIKIKNYDNIFKQIFIDFS